MMLGLSLGLTSTTILARGGGGPVVYDEDAQAYFDKLTTPLSDVQKANTNKLVIALKQFGWWEDNFDWLLLAHNPTDDMVNLVDLVKVATATSGVSHDPAGKYVPDGLTGAISFNEVFNATGNKFAQDDALIGVWFSGGTPVSGAGYGIANTGTLRAYIRQDSATSVNFSVNATAGASKTVSDLTERHYTAIRSSNAAHELFLNGGSLAANSQASTTPSTNPAGLFFAGGGAGAHSQMPVRLAYSGRIGAKTADDIANLHAILSAWAIGTEWPNPDPEVIVDRMGLNIEPPTSYYNHPIYANLAMYGPWRTAGGGREYHPDYVDKYGNIIAMRAGTPYTKNLIRTGTGISYYRATWTGAGRVSQAQVDNGLTAKPNPNNTDNLFEWSVDWSSLAYDVIPLHNLTFANSAEANPIMDLEIREIDAFDGAVLYPDRFYPSYLQRFVDWGVGRLRFLGWTHANYFNSNGVSNYIPVNWADRTPADARTISVGMVPATASTGAGTASLAFTANIALSMGVFGLPTGLIATYPVLAIGAAGNNVSITYSGSAPTGGVVVSGPPDAINIAVTMFDGETTAAQFKALWDQTCSFHGYIDGTTLHVLTVESGRLGVGFGLNGDDQPNYSYAGVDMLSRIVSQTSGDPGGVGTYEINISGSYATESIPGQITAGALGQYLALVTSGGAGDVVTFADLAMTGGHDPVSASAYPIEDMVAICNAANGADLQLPIPIGVSDDFMQGLSEYCAANLIGRFVPGVDNEIWNKIGGYLYGMLWCAALGIRSGTVPVTAQKWFDPTYGYAIRLRHLMGIAKTAYAANPKKLVRPLTCLQRGNLETANAFLSAGARDCSQCVDEAQTAPYTFNNVFPLSGKNPSALGGLVKYKGALTSGMVLQQFDYGYYGDAATGKGYFAKVACTLATDDPADDPNMLEMTMANYNPYHYADMDAQISTAQSLRSLLRSHTNDRGEKIGYSSYEGGLGQATIADGITGDGGVIMLRTIKDMFTSDALKVAESHWWHLYLTGLPGSVQCITNESSGSLHLGANYGLEVASWADDSVSPRRVAFANAAQGVFFDT